VDISSGQAVRDLFTNAAPIDGVISSAALLASSRFAQLDDEDFAFSLQNRLMGHQNVFREALLRIRDSGVVVITSGVLSRLPAPRRCRLQPGECGAYGLYAAGRPRRPAAYESMLSVRHGCPKH
jgi:hypothetical protein